MNIGIVCIFIWQIHRDYMYMTNPWKKWLTAVPPWPPPSSRAWRWDCRAAPSAAPGNAADPPSSLRGGFPPGKTWWKRGKMWKQGKTTWYTGENRGFNEVTGILKQEAGEIVMNELKFMALLWWKIGFQIGKTMSNLIGWGNTVNKWGIKLTFTVPKSII